MFRVVHAEKGIKIKVKTRLRRVESNKDNKYVREAIRRGLKPD